MSNYRVYIFLVPVLLALTASAPAKDTLGFKQAVSRALAQNHSVKIANNNAAIAANNVSIGNAGLLPSISLSSGADHTNSEPMDAATRTSARIAASYTLFSGLGNIYQYRGLQSAGRQGRLNARDQTESAIIAVSRAYFGAASAFENLAIAKELLSISRERLSRVEKRSAFGRALTIDVLAAKVDLNTDSVTYARAQFGWEESLRTLNTLLNYSIGKKYTVDTDVEFNTSYTIDELISAAEAHNASFLAALEQVNVSHWNLASAKSAHLPRIDLSGSYGYNQTGSDFSVGLDDPYKDVRMGVSIQFNLFNGFQTSIRRQNAALSMKNSELLLSRARLNLHNLVISSYESFRTSLDVLALEQRSVKAAGLNYRRTQELYHLGQVTTTQFREAQLNLIQSKLRLSTAKFTARLDEIELLRLTGRLLPES